MHFRNIRVPAPQAQAAFVCPNPDAKEASPIGPSRPMKGRMMLATLRALTAALALGAGAASAATPDFSGVWMIEKPSNELRTSQGAMPPLNAQATEIYRQHRIQLQANDRSFDPTARCISPGLPRILTLPYPFKIFQDTRTILFSFQWNRWFRYAELTGEKLDPPYPMSMGTARAHWDNNVLVIETEGLRADNTLLDGTGMPHSESLGLTERLKLVSKDTLEDRIMVSDPETFTANWETVLRFKRQPRKTEISEDVCYDRTDNGEPAVKPSS